ncbi:MAG TPA: tail fiber protein, partial [Clostridia bacterium]|nr:tail fiber protein [Clostridia bacterium]
MAIASWYAGTPGSVDIIWTDILVQREINADKTVSSVRLTIETDAADNDFYFDDIAVNYGVAINPKDITYVTRDDHTDVLPASVQHILLTSTYLHKGLAKTTSDDPLDATPGNRPAGELGEIVRYSGDGSLYYCTDETTPVWAVVGGGGGTVTSVTGTTPINSSGGTDPDISIDSASTSQPGVVQLSNSYAGTSEVLAVTELALSQGLASISTPDEKVKYDAGDSSAGYVADKFVAGDGISVAEGTGADENKLKITNTDKGSDVDLSGLCPLTHKTTEDAINGLVKVDGAGNYSGITDNSANWNSAYGWGDHASAGYFVIADNDAGDIQITDTGGFFSSTNVEGALQELGDGMTGNALEIGKTPDESPDGSETVFTVPDGEYQQNTLSVYLNGQRLTAGGTDYSETSPGDGTFTLTTAPQTGDIIQCDYQLSPEVAFDSVIPSGAMIPFSSIATRAGWTYKHEIITPSFTLPMTSLPATRKLGAVGKIGEYLYFGMGTAGGSIVSTIAKYDIAAGTWSTVTPGGDAVTARTTCGGG